MRRVAEVVVEMERQRDQLSAQGQLLQQYRQQARHWPPPTERAAAAQPPAAEDDEGEEEEPFRDATSVPPRRQEAGGDDGLTSVPGGAQDAQVGACRGASSSTRASGPAHR
ncbi:uncharacterized protein LOC119098207 [Pollicipes pollicipes]|uniref:uncharacterized protein LOC119098207 n=1 Tax=Pollicipes pollicipes TaxID=41117 RepID=UPI0018850EB3|nr:uncharacterized protein LOC119098207 [Pollicipes pollicipes]